MNEPTPPRLLMNDTPLAYRPRERCLETGPSHLTFLDCLAILLGSGPKNLGCQGLALRILQQPGQGLTPSEEERAFFTSMENTGLSFLKSIPGLGPSSQARLLAAFELGRRYTFFKYAQNRCENPFLKTKLPQRALEKISLRDRTSPQEWLGFIPLYRSGSLGDFCIVERGARTHVNVDPAELFARILALRPIGFFLFHNHPSGLLLPSQEDKDLTERVREISQTLGIRLLGHWIVTPLSESEVEVKIPTEQNSQNYGTARP